jgi:hypothetical protein
MSKHKGYIITRVYAGHQAVRITPTTYSMVFVSGAEGNLLKKLDEIKNTTKNQHYEQNSNSKFNQS